MIDYTIAIICPSRLVCDTARKVIKDMGYSYPVYAASREKAVQIAKGIIPKGVKVIISHGLTLETLRRDVQIALMELPFSGLDAALAIKEALVYSNKIVHMGTPHLYHFLQKSLEVLGVDKNLVAFCPLSLDKSIEAQTQEMLDQGYEIVIGGFPAVDYAIKQGKRGLEFNVDELIITTTIINAELQAFNMLEIEKRNELDKALLQASSDGIIAIDESRKIFRANSAAEKVLKLSENSLIGKSIDQILEDGKFVDIDSIDNIPAKNSSEYTPLFLSELPFSVHEKKAGSVVSVKPISELYEMEYQLKKSVLQKGHIAKNTFSDITGTSSVINAVKQKAQTYAKYNSTILISGETGTGKELFAQSIHNASPRKNQPFVAINCATLPDSLIESELFGYVKGAFTGANKEGKAGLFEMANKGTLFLDEISELPIAMQSKLLRAIQEGEIIRIGGDKVITVDTRIICSSNKDLLTLVSEGKFKIDLYYRLCVLELELPPLRERLEDIEPICYSLLDKYNKRYNKSVVNITSDVIEALKAMPLYGNIRELQNIVERMMILAPDNTIDISVYRNIGIRHTPKKAAVIEANNGIKPSTTDLKSTEYEQILYALEQCNGNKAKAAKLLGIHPSTLWRKLKAHV